MQINLNPFFQELGQLELKVDAAQRRSTHIVERARAKTEEVQEKETELLAAKARLQSVLGVFGLERDFRKLSQRIGNVSSHHQIASVYVCMRNHRN